MDVDDVSSFRGVFTGYGRCKVSDVEAGSSYLRQTMRGFEEGDASDY